MNTIKKVLLVFTVVLVLNFFSMLLVLAEPIQQRWAELAESDWTQGQLLITMKWRLYELGYFTDTDFSYRYTDRTQLAVRHFQEINNLPVTGWFSADDYYVLFSLQARNYVGEIDSVISGNTEPYMHDLPQNKRIDPETGKMVNEISYLAKQETHTIVLENRHYQADELLEMVGSYCNLKDIEEITISTQSLVLEDALELLSGFPGAKTHIYFSHDNALLCTDMKTVYLTDENMSLEMIDRIISAFPELERLDLFNCKMSNTETMAVSEKYPQITFGWSVVINGNRYRNDCSAYSTLGGATRKEAYYQVLQYLPHLKGLDLGHNGTRGVEFLRFFPDLKVLILVDNYLTDDDLIKIVKYTPHLVYLELWENEIKDLSPLVQLESLSEINISYNHIENVEPLLQMPWLKRVFLQHNQIKLEKQQLLVKSMPDTEFNFEGNYPTAGGWRSETSHYQQVYEMFTTNRFISWEY